MPVSLSILTFLSLQVTGPSLHFLALVRHLDASRPTDVWGHFNSLFDHSVHCRNKIDQASSSFVYGKSELELEVSPIKNNVSLARNVEGVQIIRRIKHHEPCRYYNPRQN